MSERVSTTTPVKVEYTVMRHENDDRLFITVNGVGIECDGRVIIKPTLRDWHAIAAHDAAQPGGEVEWIPPRDDVDEVPFREAVLNYGMRCKYAAREPTHQQLQWESNAFERVITEMRKITPPPASQPAKQGEEPYGYLWEWKDGGRSQLWDWPPSDQAANERNAHFGHTLVTLYTHPAQATIKDGG